MKFKIDALLKKWVGDNTKQIQLSKCLCYPMVAQAQVLSLVPA